MSTLRVYRSYSFKDKDPVIDQLRHLREIAGVSYKEIHEAGGPVPSTLYAWFEGATRQPQNPTVEAAGRAMGFQRIWATMDGRPVKAIRGKKA